jgi:GNAT superfamily N-acetyltransferase
MSHEITIRLAQPIDAATIAEFNQRLAWESEAKRLDTLALRAGVKRLLDDSCLGQYFVACRGDEIVGQLMITYEWSDWRNGHIWWVQSVYVKPEYRRTGLFRRLHAHVRAEAIERGDIVGIRLYVERNNVVAHEVYRNVGLADAGYQVMEEMFSPAEPRDRHAP